MENKAGNNLQPSWMSSAALGLQAENIASAFEELARKTDAQLEALPDQEKIELLENIYASEITNKSTILKRIFSVTRFTENFLQVLVNRVLASSPVRSVNAISDDRTNLQEDIYVNQPSWIFLEAGRLLPGTQDYLKGVASRTKAFLAVSLLLTGERGQGAREALAESIELDDEIYSFIKHHIGSLQTRNIAADIAREHQAAAAQFVLEIPPDAYSGMDDKALQLLSGMLLRITSNIPVTENWKKARKLMFERMPVPRGIQQLHEINGPRFVELALQNADLVQLSCEAEKEWSSPEWKASPEKKKSLTGSLYALLAELYSVDAPSIELGSTDKAEGVENEPVGKYSGFAGVKNAEQKWEKIWRNKVTFSMSEGRGLNATAQDAAHVIFHEFAHAIDTFVSMGFNEGDRKIYSDGGGQKAIAFTSKHPLYSVAYIFSHNKGYYSPASQYIPSAQDFDLYRTQPIEKHAIWFGAHMLNYYRVFLVEAAERKTPGVLLPKIASAIDTVVAVAYVLALAGTEPDSPQALKSDRIIRDSSDIKSTFVEGQSLSLEQIEKLNSFFENAGSMLDQASAQFSRHREFVQRIEGVRALVSSFALNEYVAYKRYEQIQGIIANSTALLPELPLVQPGNRSIHFGA